MGRLVKVLLFVLFFPLSVPAVLLVRKGRRENKKATNQGCLDQPTLDCVGCPDLYFEFRKRGLPPLLYVEDALLACDETGVSTTTSQGCLRKALAQRKVARKGVPKGRRRAHKRKRQDRYEVPYIM